MWEAFSYGQKPYKAGVGRGGWWAGGGSPDYSHVHLTLA